MDERASSGDVANAAAAGDTAAGSEDTQDGDLCDQLSNVAVFNPLSTFPAGMPPAANYARIGARPHDLGAMIRGGASIPVPGYDDGALVQAQALLSTPFSHPHGYGASFALGSGGTVAPASGAFVHPFTLLTLPSYARRMGLMLQMEYLSNATHPVVDAKPFGDGFVLTGHDFLVETAGSSPTAGATSVSLFRGDGHEVRYTLPFGNGGTGPWTYAGPLGAQDVLVASHNATTQVLTYVRTLRDGRRISYGRLGTSNDFVRSSMADAYGNALTYAWTAVAGTAQLQTITDPRGMVVQLQWDQGSPARVEKLFLVTSGVAIDPPQADGVATTQVDFTVDFAYDGSRRLRRIEWFPTRVMDDGNADGRLAVSEAIVRRPTLELEYEINGKLGKLWDKTVPAAPVLQLEVTYASDPLWGVRVVSQTEGGASTHGFAYTSPTTRTYTDPRGRVVDVILDTNEYRVTLVKMKPGTLAPRNTDGFTGDHADHVDLTWELAYSCCGLPSSIMEPSGRVFTFAWDRNSIQQVWVAGQSLHRVEVDPFGRVVRWWSGRYGINIEPALTVTYAPLLTLPATSVMLETRDYTDPRGSGSVGKSTATLTFETGTGRLLSTTHPAGGSSLFEYVPSGNAGHAFLKSVTGPAASSSLKLSYVCDDLGRPSSVTRGLTGGERETKLYVDSLGRVRRATAKATTTGPHLASEAWQDRFGKVALARGENRDSSGTARARPWLQSETLRDAQGRVVRMVRDGAEVTAANELALVTQMAWHPDHRLNAATGPNGGVTTYVWDGYGLLYKTRVMASATETLTPRRLFYNKDAQVRFVRNDLGHELKVERFGTGLVSAVHDPAGLHRLDLGYDGDQRLERIAVVAPATGTAEQRVTVLTYDELDRVKMVSTGPSGIVDSHRIHVFDLGGRLEEVGLQETRSDTAYLRGFLRQFDAYGRLEWQRDRLSDTPGQSNQVSFTYHAQSGLPTELTEREIEQVGQFGALSGSGHLQHEYKTLLAHDLLDRVTRVEQLPETGPTASVVHLYHYDSLGDLVRFQDAMNAELCWTFDAQGNQRRRVEKGTQGGEIETLTEIDFVSGVVTRTDAAPVPKVSRFRHDLAWRPWKQEFPGYTSGTAHAHSFGYDAASRLTSIVNGNGVTIQRSYDESGRLREQWAVPPLNGHSEWATKEILGYDVFGGRRDLTTKAGTTYGTHVVTASQWQDSYGRTAGEHFDFWGAGPGPGVLSVYSQYNTGGSEDLLARRGLAADGAGSVSFQLDGLGRTWGYHLGTGSGEEYIARYRFVGGRVRERQQGKQAMQQDWLLSTDHGWDPSRRLTSLETKNRATTATLSRFDHEFDLEGHLTKRKRDRVGVGAGGGDLFQLDEYYRLAGTKLGVDPSQFGGSYAGATAFQRAVEYSPASALLDKAQNRHLVRETVGSTTTDTAYTLDPSSHRYADVGGMVLTYDGEGNLVSDGWRFFVYDFKNRLSEVWQYFPVEGEQAAVSASASRDGRARYAVSPERLQRIRARARTALLAADRMRRGYADVTGRAALANQDPGLAALEGNLQLVAVYGYDPFNRRVVRHVVGELPRYSTWDGWREVAEHVWGGSGWLTFQAYVWGGRIDELIRFSRKVGETWQHFHPQQDHQDSVDLLVGADGAPKEKYEYDPFGGVTVFTWNGTAWVNPTGGSPLGNPYGYTGRRLDGETGLMYYRNRYYWPALGRFVTADPLGLWGDVHGVGNGYMYAGNSPAFLGDPLGLQVLAFAGPPPIALAGFLVGAGAAAATAATAPLWVPVAILGGIGALLVDAMTSPVGPRTAVRASAPVYPEHLKCCDGDPGNQGNAPLPPNDSSDGDIAAEPQPSAVEGGSRKPPRGWKDCLSVFRGLAPGRNKHVRTVASEDDLKAIFRWLSAGGTPVTGTNYPGELVRMPDGTEIGIRTDSRSGGTTIDMTSPDGTLKKLHL